MYKKLLKSALMIPSVEKRIKSFYGLDAEIAKSRDRYRVLRDRVYGNRTHPLGRWGGPERHLLG